MSLSTWLASKSLTPALTCERKINWRLSHFAVLQARRTVAKLKSSWLWRSSSSWYSFLSFRARLVCSWTFKTDCRLNTPKKQFFSLGVHLSFNFLGTLVQIVNVRRERLHHCLAVSKQIKHISTKIHARSRLTLRQKKFCRHAKLHAEVLAPHARAGI